MNWTMLKDNLKDVIPDGWTPERLIRALGSELRHERSSVLTPLVMLVGGAIIGAGIALMLTPKTGPELRQQVTDKLGTTFGKKDTSAEGSAIA